MSPTPNQLGARLLDIAPVCLAAVCMTVSACRIARRGSDRHLVVPAVITTWLAIMALRSATAPWFALAATDVFWLVAVVACVKVKRELVYWSSIGCGVCVTATCLASQLL